MQKGRVNSESVTGILLLIVALIIPAFVSSYETSIYASFLFSIVLCFSITFIWGYGGTFSFGQAAFYGLGAYVYGIIAGNIENPNFTFPALVIAVIIVGLIAAVLGYFMFYGGVNDVFVGIITLCVTLALNSFFGQTADDKWHIGTMKFGGYNGMNGIPKLTIGSFEFGDISFYYLGVGIVFVVVFLLLHLNRSRSGYTMFAIRENRDRSKLFGYNVPLIQTVIFGIGGAIAALAGALYGTWGSFINPGSMSMTQSTIPVVLVASAGKTSPVGTLIFAFLYYAASNVMAASGNQYSLIILGLALIFFILYIPKGLFKTIFDGIDSFVLNFRNKEEKEKKAWKKKLEIKDQY